VKVSQLPLAACRHQRKPAGPAWKAQTNPEHGIVSVSVAAALGRQCSATGWRTRQRTPAAIDKLKHRTQQAAR